MTSQEMIKHSDNVPERAASRPQVAPPVDIFETPEEFLLQADVPGADKDGVTLRFERNQLALLARCPAGQAVGMRGGPGDFDYARAFLLPGGVDAERIHAELKDGVLTVHMPKQDAFKPRQITVRAG